MNDTTAGDMPWQQPGAFNPAPPAAAPARQPRQKRKPKAEAEPPKVRKPRAVKPETEATPAPASPKKARKPREPKAERAAPETIKIGIKEYAEMRVTAFQREFVKLHKILVGIPGKARTQIIAELQKVFG